MGQVYRARDLRLGRDVAIKILSDHLAADPEMRARFEREARAVAALSHPGIVAIHELAQVDGRSVAVMELLEGESLRTRLERGPMLWRAAADMGAQISDALAAAHGKGIIHRDLKPDNVFITPDGRPKVLDFGLVRSRQPLGPAADGVTAATSFAPTETGRMLGTIGYMAPEQVRGDDVDAPADIFALGCTLCEMVTGDRIFRRNTPAESLAAILKEDPPDLLAAGRNITPEFARVVGHCLEKDPAERFQSAADLALALRALTTDSSVGLTGAPLKKAKRPPSKSLAVLPFANVGSDPATEYLADGITESIINSLSQLPGLRVVSRSTVFRYKGRDTALETIGLALNVRSLVTGRVMQQGDILNIQAELVDTATDSQLWGDQYKHPISELLTVQEEIAWRITEALRIKLTGEEKHKIKRRATKSSEAYQHYLRGRYHWNKWTAEDFKKSIECFEQAIAFDPLFALAYSGLSDTYGAMGYYGFVAPDVAMPRAKAAAQKAIALDDGLAEAHATMALGQMMHEWNWSESEREFRRAIELNPQLASARTFYGLLLASLGRSDEAIAEARRGAELDPLSPVGQMGLSWTLYFARRFREALEQVQRVLQVDPEWAEAKAALVTNYEQLGEYDKALAAFERTGSCFGCRIHDMNAVRRVQLNPDKESYWQLRLDMLLAAAKEQYVTPYGLAMSYGELGRFDEAFAALNEMVDQHSGQATFLLVDPAADPLRSDPRYDALLKRVGLAAFETAAPRVH